MGRHEPLRRSWSDGPGDEGEYDRQQLWRARRGVASRFCTTRFARQPCLVQALGLQWVNGRITVVMSTLFAMSSGRTPLQWVHGRITVVMIIIQAARQDAWVASMGPRSDNRGYA